MDVVVGLDAGTTATKAVTAGVDGRVRDSASAGYPLLVPSPGRAELDGTRLAGAAVEALRAVVALAHDRGDDVVGVCLSAAMHGLVPLDADGTPSGPVVTWADGRAAAQAAALRAGGQAEGLHRRTGTPVHPMSPLVKLVWEREHDARRFRGTARWGGVKALLLAALCGEPVTTDVSSASATGLWSLREARWDDEALRVAGVTSAQLPEVVPTTHRLHLRDDVAARTGLRADVPVVVGASDGALATLGTGVCGPETAAVSLGTSGALRTVVAEPVADPAGRLFCYALADGLWVTGGAVSNGGSVVRWAAQALADEGGPPLQGEAADARDALLLEEAEQAPPGAAGLLCLPYLLGERAPWWRSDLRGAYLGLRRDHRRAHLVRAAVEGVCQQLALVGAALDGTGAAPREVRATGGAVASPLWVRTLASTLALPVRLADSTQGTALGACLLGWHALGALPRLEDAARRVAVGPPAEPDPDDASRYARMRPVVERATLALAAVLADMALASGGGREQDAGHDGLL